VQIQKAAATYGWGDAPDYNTFTWNPSATPPTLQFALSEAGKAVSLSYYRDVDINHNGYGAGAILRQYVPSEMVVIDNDGFATFCPSLPDPLNPGPGNNFPTRPSPGTAVTAKGVSLTARILWAGRGRSEVPAQRPLFSPARAATIRGEIEFLNERWRQAQVTSYLIGSQ
jgi:hypothetical protein